MGEMLARSNMAAFQGIPSWSVSERLHVCVFVCVRICHDLGEILGQWAPLFPADRR